MNNAYKILSINFKKQHREIYEWLKNKVDSSGSSFSEIVRNIIKNEMKREMNNE